MNSINILGRLFIVLAIFSLAGCKFAAKTLGSAPLSSNDANSVVLPIGNGGDDGNGDVPPPPPASGIFVSNQRECLLRQSEPLYYEQQFNGIFAVHKFLDGPSLNVVTPAELRWSIASVSQNQAMSGYRSILTYINASSEKESGVFTRTTFGESGFGTYLDLRRESINLPVSEARIAAIRAHAAARVDASGQPNGAVVLVIHGDGKVLATSTTLPSTGDGGSPMGLLSNGNPYEFQITTRIISGLNNCTGDDLPPEIREMCEEECDVFDSPLVLDLKGNGIRSTNLANGVRFDIDADGNLDRVAWIAGDRSRGWDDAFLARDLNRNGRIDNGSELFGQATRLEDGQLPVNGFIALKALDSNGDNKFDFRDPNFGELLLWQDKNQNGRSEPTELLPLAQQVRSIDLNFQATNRRDANGNKILAVSTFEDLAGRIKDVIDIFFASEQE